MISFAIPGNPQQQGSKTRGRYGGSFDDNPHLNAWRQDAIACALDARPPSVSGAVLLGPVEVRASFVFPRRKGHYGTGRNARILKPSAPHWVATKPDEDKLQRALGDVLQFAGIVRDDCQIARWVAEKVYGDLPVVRVQVIPLSDLQPLPVISHSDAALMDVLVTA